MADPRSPLYKARRPSDRARRPIYGKASRRLRVAGTARWEASIWRRQPWPDRPYDPRYDLRSSRATPSKRIIVLANSIKKSARCVAGIDVGTGKALVPAGWIRPVSGESEGELEPRHMQMNDGAPLTPFDIVDVPLTQYAKDTIHPEDWIVDAGTKWTRVGHMDAKTLGLLEEQPKDLWLEPTSHRVGVTGSFLSSRPKHQSLYLIRPTDLRIELSYEHNPFKNYNQRKTRTRFVYREHEYLMSLTDPAFTAKHCTKYPALGEAPAIIRPPYGDKCLLCVSLTPEFNGYHYKIVATVLELP